MAQNICINGESACHAGSDGKLTTSDTCMTPPFCIPISYTNIAESKVADQTVSSVKIQGNPACNQKSVFKISQGDSPGCCGGVSSGSTQQMTKFLEGSSNVTIGGEPAVFNGLLKVSNAENTDPKPLIQPPADKAPANTTEAPATTGEFSQQFDFMAALGSAPGKTTIIERPVYEIWTKDGERLGWGNLSAQGLTERVFTLEKTDLVAWIGDGEWRIIGEHEHEDSGAEAPTTATVDFVFFNFAMAYLPELEYKLVAGDQTVTGKTGFNGATQTLKDIKPGTRIEIWVQKKLTKQYKKIGTEEVLAGATYYHIISPKIEAESTTYKQPPAAPQVAAPAGNTHTTPAQNTTPSVKSNANNLPVAEVKQDPALVEKESLTARVLRFMSHMFGTLDGNEKLYPVAMCSRASMCTPLSESNDAKLKKFIAFAEAQVKFDHAEYTKVNGYLQTLARFKESETHPDFGTDGKDATEPGSYCLSYVKMALMHTGMISGFPKARLAKRSIKDWKQFDYADVTDKLPKVKITYHGVYSEADETSIESHLDNRDDADANAQSLNEANTKAQSAWNKKKKEALACDQEIARLSNLRHPTAHDAEKIAAEQKKKTALDADLKTTEAEAKAAQAKANDARSKTASTQRDVDRDTQKARNNDFKDQETTTIEQPDLLHSLPGDLIVYETVMKGLDPHSSTPSLDYPGHIDIRTYHGFYSDFVSKYPLPVLGNSSRKVYKVIGVFRKISDTMALARVEAFLRIIREYAVGEKSPEDRDKSYKVLSYDKDNKEKPVVWIEGGLDKHPAEKSKADMNKDISAGAYQLSYSIWNSAIKRMGWPRTFDGKMQDRVAMYQLQSIPHETIDDAKCPRLSALGYIMEGDLDKALNEPKLIKLYPFLPSGKKEQLKMTELNTKFKQYLKEVTNV